MSALESSDRFGLYQSVVRRLLFRLDPEMAHHLTIQACRAAGMVPGVASVTRRLCDIHDEALQITVAGLSFANPIGLAAGWDKNGQATRVSDQLGFGFTEIGSVSAEASTGNPKPRLFRLPNDHALIVNYGLPNEGAIRIAKRLRKHVPRNPRGANIVATNHSADAPACSPSKVMADYSTSSRQLQDGASYLTLNLSCPNAKDGRDFFSQPGRIHELLSSLKGADVSVPVFLKVPPSLLPRDHDRWLAESEEFPFVRGFVFNLAPGKPEWLRMRASAEMVDGMPGAVSGTPVCAHMNQCIAALYSRMDRQRYSIIGSGGVFTADDAWQKICLGASLIQIYTALIYHGPRVARRINQGLLRKMREHGYHQISDAIGTANPDP